jgi:putative transcriptional regulator
VRTRIKELRARYDLTQDDLAKKVGVRRETILYLEKGKYNPSLKLAHDIAKALRTTLDDLFIFEENQEKPAKSDTDWNEGGEIMWELWLIIAVTVAVLVVIFGALFMRKKQALPNSPVYTLAIALVVLGITFGDDPLIRYSFLGTSMVLSVIYAVKSSRKK